MGIELQSTHYGLRVIMTTEDGTDSDIVSWEEIAYYLGKFFISKEAVQHFLDDDEDSSNE